MRASALAAAGDTAAAGLSEYSCQPFYDPAAGGWLVCLSADHFRIATRPSDRGHIRHARAQAAGRIYLNYRKPCPRCGAVAGQDCHERGVRITQPHRERVGVVACGGTIDRVADNQRGK